MSEQALTEVCIPAPGRAELRPLRSGQARPGDPLGDDQVEGRAVASAISPGTELGWAFAGGEPSRFPVFPGYAMVFRVERAGPASGIAPGSLVFTTAPHRSWVRARAAEVWMVPEGLAPADACLARLAGVSWSTVTTTAARSPARVAVSGLGIVGNLAAQVLAGCGYRVLACDPVAERRALLAGRGIEVAPALPLADPTWSGQTALVVDCSGHEAAVLDACKLVRKGGEVVMVGVPWRRRSDEYAFALLDAVFHRYVVLRSGWEWEVPVQPADFRPGSIRDNLAAALAWLRDGRLRTAGLYRPADPCRAEEVYRALQLQRGGGLTAVFDWAGTAARP